MGGDGADSGEGDVLGAEEAVADFAEPGGAEGAGLRTLDEDFNGGVGEDKGDSENAIDFSEKGQGTRTSVRVGGKAVSSALLSVPIC